ncbi:hypothetical protein T484DRAFT_1848916 [Baffinella frigidus]|nr:hypothetical protein T484DRAFT_1848916 [Cryptophyta sp. CCMP2293]
MLRSRLIQTVLVVLAVSLPETGSRGATYPAAAAPTKSTNSHPGVDACHKQGRLGGCRGARVPVLRALRGGGSGFGTGAPLGPTKWQDNEKALEMYHNALRERPKDANLWSSPPAMAPLLVCMSGQSLRMVQLAFEIWGGRFVFEAAHLTPSTPPVSRCSFGHAITQLTGNYGRAGMAYRRAIELQANHSTALNNLGCLPHAFSLSHLSRALTESPPGAASL